MSKLLNDIKTVEDFSLAVKVIEGREGYVRPQAFAVGVKYTSSDQKVLCVHYPHVNLDENYGAAAIFHEGWSMEHGTDCEEAMLRAFTPFASDGKTHANVDALKDVIAMARDSFNVSGNLGGSMHVEIVFIEDLNKPPVDVADAYLRLHLLSHRKCKPNTISLEGIFDLLPNVCWTNAGPVSPSEFRKVSVLYMKEGQTGFPLQVRSLDKFPPMLDFVVPSGVRIADGNRVRLGAYLGEGTTVMHEGFVNFNAGTLGKSMVEGRIPPGVTVDDGSDIGGGASIMGTLSGGGKEVITVGKRCLIGANAGTGISLGDGCKIEAGLYVTAGTPVYVEESSGWKGFVKASTLSGRSGLTYIRNGKTGAVMAVPTKGVVVLNKALHSN